MARIDSRVCDQRWSKSPPMICVSSRSQPAPMPKRKRPRLNRSRVEISLARRSGCRSGTRTRRSPPSTCSAAGGDLLGEEERMPLGDEDDARAELDAAGHAGGPGQSHERIDEMRIALGNDAVRGPGEAAGRMHGNERMLGAPERLETELLGFRGHEADVDE